MVRILKLHILGQDVELPQKIDCPNCGRKEACEWAGVAYDKPCGDCKQKTPTTSYQWKNGDPLKNRQITGVFQGKGTTFYTNYKGDIVRTEPYKPLGQGKETIKKASRSR